MDDLPTQDKLSLPRLAFKELKENEVQEMAALTHFSHYPAGQVLCHEGEYEDSFYIVAEGNVVVSKKMLGGEGEHVLRVGGRGDLVGEMGLIQHAPRAATVRTLTECTLLEMGKKDFETILSRSSHMAIDIIRITLDRLRANDHMAIAELQRINSVLRQLDRNKLEFLGVLRELAPPEQNGMLVSMSALAAIEALGEKAASLQEFVRNLNPKGPSPDARYDSYVPRLIQNIAPSEAKAAVPARKAKGKAAKQSP